MMHDVDHSESYTFIRDKFIETAEREHVPISPNLGRLQEAAIGGVVYSEWTDDRGFQISISHPEAPTSIDFAVTTMPYQARDLPLLKLFTSNVKKDWSQLWDTRCIWFNYANSPDKAENLVEQQLGSR